jgi:phosphohistidine phosphatase
LVKAERDKSAAGAGKPSKAGRSASPPRQTKGPLRVLVVRHGVAEDKAAFAATGAPDADRPLTGDGRRKFRRAARGLVELVPELGALATSPLVRAVETADLLARRYAKAGREPKTTHLSALAPGKSSSLLLGWLAEQPRGQPVAVVGHEPHLGEFVGWALTGLRVSFVEFKKGAACLLEFEDDVRPGKAKLLWSLRPGQLRAVGRAGPED